MTEQQQPPLWHLLRGIADEEFIASLDNPNYDQLASERRQEVAIFFRDLADQLVPEEECQWELFTPEWHQWAQRFRIRQRLLAEAARDD